VSLPSEVYCRVTRKYYRSFFEAYFARFCQDKEIDYRYEPFTYQIDTRQYTPDFYLPQLGLHIECKGKWLGSKEKYLSARQQINIILLPAYLQNEFKKEYGIKDEIIK
jgi:hypothetical protein